MVNEWNKLDLEIKKIDSYLGFSNKLQSFINLLKIRTLAFTTLRN